MSSKLYAIFEATETEQVVASMAVQAGFSVISNLPILRTTQEFIEWSEYG